MRRLLSVCFLVAATTARAQQPSTDLEARRSVRGGPVEAQPNESPELYEMRRFEERSFPRAGAPVLPPALDADGPASQVDQEDLKDIPDKLRGHTAPSKAAPRANPSEPDAFLRTLKLPDLPMRWDPRVQRYLQFYKSDPKGRAIMSAWLRKQGRYRALMEDALRRHDLPRDLIYVAMIESGYEPSDLSRVGALGLWQFPELTGKIYGLEKTYWVDQRKNPERSTEAVAIYFHDLYVRFGNWHLALAAFNAGYGAVLRSMQKYNTNDYWELCKHESGLPWETCLYVSKTLATATVGGNRNAFGYDGLEPDPAWAYERVRVPGGTRLVVAAKAAGATEAQLAYLNPELRRGRTPPGHEWELRIPHGTLEAFTSNFPSLRKEGDRYEVYVLKFGERLDDVARAKKVNPKELRRINGVTDSTEVRGGTEILIPRERGKVSEADLPAAEDDNFLVAVPDRPFQYADRTRIFYRTRDGDTVDDIARTFGVRPTDLATWNNLALDANLASRMVLQLFVARDRDLTGVVLLPEEKVHVVTVGSAQFLDGYAQLKGRKRTLYKCKAGDTMAKVGRRFGLTPGDLARINQISYESPLVADQELVVYIPVTAQAKKEAQGRLRQYARMSAKYAPARKRRKSVTGL
jgi:membrane-bound lytic murein transglycosylase D